MTRILLGLTLLGLGAHLSGCSAQTESPSAGSCALNCSSPRAAGAEFFVTPLIADGDESPQIQCSAAFTDAAPILPTNGPIQVKYLVYETVPDFGTSLPPAGGGTGSTTGGTSGGTTGGTTGTAGALNLLAPGDPLLSKRPVGGVGFEPWLYGDLAVGKTNPEFQIPGQPGQISSFKYAGVVTPSAEWCSDSCGVITYEFWPDCERGKSNPVTASVVVGGIRPTKDFKFTLQNTTQ